LRLQIPSHFPDLALWRGCLHIRDQKVKFSPRKEAQNPVKQQVITNPLAAHVPMGSFLTSSNSMADNIFRPMS